MLVGLLGQETKESQLAATGKSALTTDHLPGHCYVCFDTRIGHPLASTAKTGCGRLLPSQVLLRGCLSESVTQGTATH
jgi:hypothetical protein